MSIFHLFYLHLQRVGCNLSQTFYNTEKARAFSETQNICEMMNKLSVIFCLLVAAPNANAQTDSIRTEQLQEIVVTADGQIETADKTLLLPTQLEKKHAANGFNLLYMMQVPDLEVSARTRSITTHNGGEVVLCINGMEALAEDVASLSAKNIRTIEYIRTPSGKYAGKPGLLNFVTVKMNYGGNVYLSASEGFCYKHGDYMAFADFNRKRHSFSLTATGNWSRNHSYDEGEEAFAFSGGSSLERSNKDNGALRKDNSQALRMRFTATGDSHRLNAYVNLARQAMPGYDVSQAVFYNGSYGTTNRITSSNNLSIAPSAYANYTLWLPKEQMFDFTASTQIGHNKYYSLYTETKQTELETKVTEDNYAFSGNARYSKTWKNNLSIAGSLNNDYKHYTDFYAGSASGRQRLTSNVSVALLQLSKYNDKYYYYVSAGLSNSAVSLNGTHYDYCMPVAFYGGNYALNSKHSLSLNGLFTHTLFDPSDKNAMTVPTSFFEATCGNPDLAPMKVLGNTLSYNGQFGKSRVSFSYDNNIYFDNIVHRYTADSNTIFDKRINGTTFYGNMFTASYTCRLLNEHLRLSVTAIEEYNMLRGSAYNMSRNVFRMKGGLVCLAGEWTFSFDYRTPYTSLDIHQPWLIRRRPVYEWKIGWAHKSLTVEALVRNPFSRYDKQHITMDYGCYSRNSWKFNEAEGRDIRLTMTYSISYGKKSERGDMEVNKGINSAIMKAY